MITVLIVFIYSIKHEDFFLNSIVDYTRELLHEVKRQQTYHKRKYIMRNEGNKTKTKQSKTKQALKSAYWRSCGIKLFLMRENDSASSWSCVVISKHSKHIMENDTLIIICLHISASGFALRYIQMLTILDSDLEHALSRLSIIPEGF